MLVRDALMNGTNKLISSSIYLNKYKYNGTNKYNIQTLF